MLLYIIKSALLLAILYGSFALLLSRETFHRFNRAALLCVLVISMVLPFVQLTIRKPKFLSYEEVPMQEAIVQPDIQFEEEYEVSQHEEQLEIVNSTEQERPFTPSLEGIVEAAYFLGLFASLAIFFVQLFRLFKEIKGGVHTKDEFGNTIVIHGGNFAPYSFLHYIIINASDYEHLRQPILAHEQAHIRLGHTWDLLLLEAVKALQWFNPFVYLLGRDLKAVHEYEANTKPTTPY